MRRISSLNDLVEFRRTLDADIISNTLQRPRSVVDEDKNDFFRRYSDEEYNEEKKHPHHHSSLKRFGSALHASFR